MGPVLVCIIINGLVVAIIAKRKDLRRSFFLWLFYGIFVPVFSNIHVFAISPYDDPPRKYSFGERIAGPARKIHDHTQYIAGPAMEMENQDHAQPIAELAPKRQIFSTGKFWNALMLVMRGLGMVILY